MPTKSRGLARVQVVGSDRDDDAWFTRMLQLLPAAIRVNDEAAMEETSASVRVAVTEALEAFSRTHGTPVFIGQLNIEVKRNAPINVVKGEGGGVYITINNAVAEDGSNPQAHTDARTSF